MVTVRTRVNADIDFQQAPPVALAHVLRDVIWRILYLRGRFGPNARIVLSKIDVTEAFRQVSVQWVRAPVFGYGFREWIDTDRRLQFGWRSSPGFVCMFSAALEHAHRHTSYEDAVVMEQGRIATQHVAVTPPRATDRPTLLPPVCRVTVGKGGGKRTQFFVLYYVDGGILVEVHGGPTVGVIDVRPHPWRWTILGFSGRDPHGTPLCCLLGRYHRGTSCCACSGGRLIPWHRLFPFP